MDPNLKYSNVVLRWNIQDLDPRLGITLPTSDHQQAHAGIMSLENFSLLEEASTNLGADELSTVGRLGEAGARMLSEQSDFSATAGTLGSHMDTDQQVSGSVRHAATSFQWPLAQWVGMNMLEVPLGPEQRRIEFDFTLTFGAKYYVLLNETEAELRSKEVDTIIPNSAQDISRILSDKRRAACTALVKVKSILVVHIYFALLYDAQHSVWLSLQTVCY
jgi:hypothetical protein